MSFFSNQSQTEIELFINSIIKSNATALCLMCDSLLNFKKKQKKKKFYKCSVCKRAAAILRKTAIQHYLKEYKKVYPYAVISENGRYFLNPYRHIAPDTYCTYCGEKRCAGLSKFKNGCIRCGVRSIREGGDKNWYPTKRDEYYAKKEGKSKEKR